VLQVTALHKPLSSHGVLKVTALHTKTWRKSQPRNVDDVLVTNSDVNESRVSKNYSCV